MPVSKDAPAGVWTALFTARKEIQALAKDAANPHFKSRYTTLTALVTAVQPQFDANDLVWSAKPRRNESGFLELAWTLRHVKSEEWIEGAMPLLLVKEDMQAFGSAITYARRYVLEAVLNLVSEDDDGNAASAPSASQVREQAAYGTPPAGRKPSEKQLGYLRKLVTDSGAEKPVIAAMLKKVGSKADPDGKWTLEIDSAQVSAMIDMFLAGALPAPERPSDIPDEVPQGSLGTDPDGMPF